MIPGNDNIRIRFQGALQNCGRLLTPRSPAPRSAASARPPYQKYIKLPFTFFVFFILVVGSFVQLLSYSLSTACLHYRLCSGTFLPI